MITKEKFLCLAHVDLSRRITEVHFSKQAFSLRGDNEAKPELGNLVQDTENYNIDYSSIVSDERANGKLASLNHKYMPRLMHERTGHGNKSMLVECVKFRLVTGLKTSGKINIIFVCRTTKCLLCVFGRGQLDSFNKVHKFRGNNLKACMSEDVVVFVDCPSSGEYKYIVDLRTMPQRNLGYIL